MTRASRDVPISPVDAANFRIGVRAQPYLVTIAGLLSSGGFVDREGQPDIARLHRTLAPRIAREPLLQQRPVMRSKTWWWTECDINLDFHISLEQALPTEVDFEAVCARLVMQPLDPTRPLWHIALVPATRPGQCGIIIRVHHAVLDGANAGQLFERVFAPAPSAMQPASVRATRTEHQSSPTLRTTATTPWERFRFRFGTFLHRPIRSRVLLGTFGATRAISAVGVDIGRLEDGAREAGGTLNDAYLVAAGAGLRCVLEGSGEPIPSTVAVSVPVAVTAIGQARNAVGFMIIDVPLRETVPARAIAMVAKQTDAAKPSARAAGTTFRSPRIAGAFDKFAQRQRSIAAVVSNVYGPNHQLVLDGAPLVELWPIGPLAGNVRVGFTASSYANKFWIGIQTDAEHLPPARDIAHAVDDALNKIADASRT